MYRSLLLIFNNDHYCIEAKFASIKLQVSSEKKPARFLKPGRFKDTLFILLTFIEYKQRSFPPV